jgi:type I restriction enzyme S subunit
MSLCDELEARQQKKRESRAHINSAALDRLLAARAPREFAQGWRRICDNFDLLYDAPENVNALRKAILQLAVLGKLVKQEEGDEPTEKLLARILAERRAKWETHLCLKGKDPKKEKYVEMQSPNIEGMPSIPESWKWVSWETILDHENGGFRRGPFGSTLTKSIFVESGYKVYEQYCPINDDCSFGRYFITPEKFEELKSFEVRAGDYLVSC